MLFRSIQGNIAFTNIVPTVATVVDQLRSAANSAPRDLADVSALEQDARQAAEAEVLKKRL